jgi:hypothetical protein
VGELRRRTLKPKLVYQVYGLPINSTMQIIVGKQHVETHEKLRQLALDAELPAENVRAREVGITCRNPSNHRQYDALSLSQSVASRAFRRRVTSHEAAAFSFAAVFNPTLCLSKLGTKSSNTLHFTSTRGNRCHSFVDGITALYLK